MLHDTFFLVTKRVHIFHVCVLCFLNFPCVLFFFYFVVFIFFMYSVEKEEKTNLVLLYFFVPGWIFLFGFIQIQINIFSCLFTHFTVRNSGFQYKMFLKKILFPSPFLFVDNEGEKRKVTNKEKICVF